MALCDGAFLKDFGSAAAATVLLGNSGAFFDGVADSVMVSSPLGQKHRP